MHANGSALMPEWQVLHRTISARSDPFNNCPVHAAANVVPHQIRQLPSSDQAGSWLAYEASVVTNVSHCFTATAAATAAAAAADNVVALQAPLELISAEGLTRLDLSHRALTGCYHVHGDVLNFSQYGLDPPLAGS